MKMHPPILVSQENPNGLKLETVTSRIKDELRAKTVCMEADDSLTAKLVACNNLEIIGLLEQIEAIQKRSYLMTGKVSLGQEAEAVVKHHVCMHR